MGLMKGFIVSRRFATIAAGCLLFELLWDSASLVPRAQALRCTGAQSSASGKHTTFVQVEHTTSVL